MFSKFVPQWMYQNIYRLELGDLRDRGIRVIFADLDNTLAAYGQKEPDQRLRDWLVELEKYGLRLFVISNSRKSHRAGRFCNAADIPFIRHAGKPKKKGFIRAMDICNVRPSQCIMVGDQIFTDILGANRAGIISVLVKPVRLDTVFRKLRFFIEWPFRAASPWNGGKFV